MVLLGHAVGYQQGDAASARRAAHHPRHRRRRADREGASLAEPEALEARAAARLLWRCRHHQRAQRHAENVRADEPAFRLGQAAETRIIVRQDRLSARPRATCARGGEPGLNLPSRRAQQEGGAPADRRAPSPQGTGADRARGRRQAGTLGAAGGARSGRGE